MLVVVNSFTYYSMEFAAFVPLRPPLSILGFSGTVLTEVLCGLWCYVCKELHLDTSKRLS